MKRFFFIEILFELTIRWLANTALLLRSGVARVQNERSTRAYSEQKARVSPVVFIWVYERPKYRPKAKVQFCPMCGSFHMIHTSFGELKIIQSAIAVQSF